jgi:hypothetical protein
MYHLREYKKVASLNLSSNKFYSLNYVNNSTITNSSFFIKKIYASMWLKKFEPYKSYKEI